jgi:glycosyltransferase involved in cell wall biosynthesis
VRAAILASTLDTHTLRLAGGLCKGGHDITVIVGRHPTGMGHEIIGGAEIYYTQAKPTTKEPLGRETLLKLQQLNSAKPFDVVHGQSYLSAYHFVQDGLKKKFGVPLVITMDSTPQGEIRINFKRDFTTTVIPEIALQTFNYFFRAKPVISSSDAVIAQSKELAESIMREFNISPSRVKTIYSGMDTDIFKPTKSQLRGSYSAGKLLLVVSAQRKQNGVQFLIEALNEVLKKIPNVHLLIVGDGPYKKELKKLADNLSLQDYVTFVGNKKGSELPEYYNVADAVVIPAIKVDGIPQTTFEAMSCGRPLIASNIGGIPTVIDSGINGILVKPQDVAGLTLNIIDVLSDSMLADRLSKRARKTIEEGFSIESMVMDTLKVYESVAAAKLI